MPCVYLPGLAPAVTVANTYDAKDLMFFALAERILIHFYEWFTYHQADT